MSNSPTPEQETWVMTSEAVELTGYNIDHVRKLARDMWALPESERLIRIRKRSKFFELWLPDLINYINNHGNGPRNSPKK